MSRKRFIILFISLAVSSFCFGQKDSFFVKTNGDTIKCVITRVSPDYLFYSIDEMRSRIELREVQFHTEVQSAESILIDSFPDVGESNKPDESSNDLFERLSSHDYNQKVRFAINFGAGYRIGQANPDLPRSYTDQLRVGFLYSAKFQVFGRRDLGFGVEFHQFLNKAKDRIPFVGDVSDDTTISYIGIASVRRNQETESIRSYLSAGFGVVLYEDDAEANGQPLLIEGTTFGVNIEYGYDIAISESSAIGFNIGILIGRLYSVKVNGSTVNPQNPNEGEGLARVNLGIGYRFSK